MIRQESRSPSARTRLDSLTGLRFAAAFMVLGFHLEGVFYFTTPMAAMTPFFVQGPAGVSFFFVLSGFVLTWSHRDDDARGAFYKRRGAKILPLHLLTFLVMAIVLIHFAQFPAAQPTMANLALLSPWIPGDTYHLVLNNPSWSLGCEMFFYALFPLVLGRLRRVGQTPRRLLLAALVLSTIIVAAAAGPYHPDTLRVWVLYDFPPTRLIEFVLGMVLALEVAENRLPRLNLLLVSLLALGAYVADGWAPASFQPVAVTLVPFSALIVAAAQSDCVGAPSLWRSPTVVRLGVWSFALYMVHWPILIVMRHYIASPLGDGPTVALGLGALGVCIAASALAYRFVEHPLELRLRPKQRAVLEPAAQA